MYLPLKWIILVAMASSWGCELARVNFDPDREVVYCLPYAFDERYFLTQPFFGVFSHDDMYAVDFRMPIDTEIRAARGGVVVDLESSSDSNGKNQPANYIIIEHPDFSRGVYKHLKYHGVLVEYGQRVKAREVIGLSGNTGYSTRPHLHFEVRAPRGIEGVGRRNTIPFKFRGAGGTSFVPDIRFWYRGGECVGPDKPRHQSHPTRSPRG